MADPFQQKVDEFLSRVYSHGGAVSTTWSDDRNCNLVSMMSLSGILTKFESIDEAIVRLDEWEEDHGNKSTDG